VTAMKTWKELPRAARDLIIYYTIATMMTPLEFFFNIFMFALGIEVEMVGILYAFHLLFVMIFSIVFGYFIDIRVSPKYLIMLIDSIGIVTWILTARASSPFHFLLIYMVEALEIPFFVAYRALERDVYPQDKLNIAYKYHMIFPYLSQAIMTLVYGVMLELNLIIIYRILAIFGAILSLILVIWVWKRIPPTTNVHLRKNKGLHLRINKPLLFLAIAEILIIFTFNIAPFFILDNFLFNIVGVTPFGIALVYSTGAFLGLLGAVTYGELKEKGSLTRVAIGIFLLSLGALALYLMNYIKYVVIIAIIAMILMYFGNSIWWIEHQSLIMKEVPEDVRGTFFGLLRTIRAVIIVPCPIIAVLLIKINPLMPYLLQALLMPLMIIFYVISIYYRGNAKSINLSAENTI